MEKTRSTAWYAWRRTLPEWCFEELLEDLVKNVKQYKIDEVVIKVDTEEFSHGHPSLAWLKNYQSKLIRIREELQAIGVVYSLNPWITVGHADRGRDDRTRITGLQPVVGHDGSECCHCACPLSEAWREYIQKLWTIYAETKPHVLWVEDDIRTFNHEPVEWGCFCPEHLKLFGTRVHATVTAKELVVALLTGGEAHPWRREFLSMQSQIMTDTVRMLAQCVHAVSPETSLGLMSSGPRNHCMEGRKWQTFIAALADGQPLYSRPTLSSYSESSLLDFYTAQDSIKLTRHVMPKGGLEQTEVENYPYGKYANSCECTVLKCMVSFAFGADGVAMNLFDHLGSTIGGDNTYGKVLAAKKPYFQALTTALRETAPTYRGVRIAFREDYADTVQVRNRNIYELRSKELSTAHMLEAFGIPTTYDSSAVVVITGEVARSIPDEELKSIFSGGVFLDGEAASILVERGFGTMIGLQQIEPPQRRKDFAGIIAAEELLSGDPTTPRQYLSANLPDASASALFMMMRPLPEVQVESCWVNPDTERLGPAMIRFENPQGGRVVIHGVPYRDALGSNFYSEARCAHFYQIFDYLYRNSPEIMIKSTGAYPLGWRRSGRKFDLAGCFNLSRDPEHISLVMRWDGAVEEIFMLDSAGRWRRGGGAYECDGRMLKLELRQAVACHHPAVVKIVHRS